MTHLRFNLDFDGLDWSVFGFTFFFHVSLQLLVPVALGFPIPRKFRTRDKEIMMPARTLQD